MIDWQDRWDNATDTEFESYIRSPDQVGRMEAYCGTLLEYLKPRIPVPWAVLDIGGGTGDLGRCLSKYVDLRYYVVLDHPRVIPWLWEEATFFPRNLHRMQHKYDLVVNTNSFGEMDLDTVTAYIRSIEEGNSKYLYSVNRIERQVNFDDYPLENCEPIISRVWSRNSSMWEFLGKNKNDG